MEQVFYLVTYFSIAILNLSDSFTLAFIEHIHFLPYKKVDALFTACIKVLHPCAHRVYTVIAFLKTFHRCK